MQTYERQSDNQEKAVLHTETDRLAELLANFIEKYADKIDLDALPDPPRPIDEKNCLTTCI